MKWLAIIALCGCGRGFFNPMPTPVDADAVIIDAAPSGPPPTYVQSNSAQITDTANQATFVLAQHAGDTVLVIVAWTNASSSLTMLMDDSGNQYASAIGPEYGPNGEVQSIFIASPIAASSAGDNTVLVGFSLNTQSTVAIVEYANVDPAAPIDAIVGNVGDATDQPTSHGLTATHDNDLLMVATSGDGLLSGQVSDYTQRISSGIFLLEDTVAGSSGVFSAQLPPGTSGNWVMQLIALRGL